MRPRLLIALAALALVAATAPTWAAFSKTTSNGSNVVTAKRIFPTTRTTTAWSVNDQADGTAANANDQGAFAGDGRNFDGGAFATAFFATRYTETAYSSPLPNGISLSGVKFNLNFRPNTNGDTACIYFETRVTSTGALLQAHGDAVNTVSCASGTSFTSISPSLPEVTSSAIANDLTIRVYAKNSGSRPINIDLGTVSGTAANGYGTFTLLEVNYLDRATGTAAPFPYGPATVDSTSATYTNWTSAFGTGRFLEFTFPSDFVPSGATITSVTFKNTFRSSGSTRSTCLYYEFYSGAAPPVATRASSASPSCSDTVQTWKQDSYSLTEVDTAAEVDGLKAKIYGRDTGSVASRHDLVTLTVSYYLD